MKKPLLLLTMALSTATASFGQSHHTPCSERIARLPHPAHTAAKTTAGNAARCIAIGVSENIGSMIMVVDTESYVYSGSRGGSVMGTMKYDNGTTYYNSGSSLDPNQKYVQTFDSHNNILTHTVQQYDVPSSTFTNYQQSAYTYDASNNLLTETTQTWDVPTSAWVNYSKTTYTYNTSNLPLTNTQQIWMGSTWINNTFDSISYNAANKETEDLGKSWNPSSTTWDLNTKITFTYDASNNLASQVYQSWDGIAWVNNYQRLYSNYSVPGLYQRIISQYWTGTAYENEMKDSITYNTYNQPVYYIERPWSSTSGTWMPDTFISVHFYYELYASGVPNINSNETTLDVYPNPASDVINIKTVLADSRNTAITLQDVTGRVVRTIDVTGLKEGLNNVQLSAEQLPAGIYFVHLSNDQANVTKELVISR